MKYYWIIILCLFCFTMGTAMGMFAFAFGENEIMKDYDLYNCIYNNADMNSFTKSPYLIEKIQDECICFREHNYTKVGDYC